MSHQGPYRLINGYKLRHISVLTPRHKQHPQKSQINGSQTNCALDAEDIKVTQATSSLPWLPPHPGAGGIFWRAETKSQGAGVQGATGEWGLSVRHALLVGVIWDGRFQNRPTCFLIPPVLIWHLQFLLQDRTCTLFACMYFICAVSYLISRHHAQFNNYGVGGHCAPPLDWAVKYWSLLDCQMFHDFDSLV